MENKFRYILFPNNLYNVRLKDSQGNPIDVEIPGEFILAQLQRTYDIDSGMLDKSREEW